MQLSCKPVLTCVRVFVCCLQVVAVAYDNPIPGYATPTTSNLRLWDAEPVEEFDLTAFNAGDYDKVGGGLYCLIALLVLLDCTACSCLYCLGSRFGKTTMQISWALST